MVGAKAKLIARYSPAPQYFIVLCIVGEIGHVITMFLAVVLPFLLVFGLPISFSVNEWFREHQHFRNFFALGRGGSARWGSIYSYIKYDFSDVMSRVAFFFELVGTTEDRRKKERQMIKSESASIVVGETFRSLDPKLGCRVIGLDSEAHMLTVAMTGGGKSVNSAFSGLSVWPGGAFILDPKGEHVKQTYQERRKYGACHVLDFWERSEFQDWQRAHYNPLDMIDIDSHTAASDLLTIASACLPEEKDKSEHFRDMAQSVMVGYIVHVMTKYPKEHHNLVSVYDTILYGKPDGHIADPEAHAALVTAMATNNAVGGAAAIAADILQTSHGHAEGSGYRNTVTKGLKWVADPVFRKYLKKSSFDLTDIQDEKETVYFVIRIEDIRKYGAFFKILVNQGFLACEDEASHNKRTLFCFDEFAQLNTFKDAKEGLVTMRGRKVKLWMHVQHLQQLQDRYGSLDDFLGMCDLQFFSINDPLTMKVISERLGEYNDRWSEGQQDTARSMDRTYPLRTPSEVSEDLKLKSGVQYVFPRGWKPHAPRSGTIYPMVSRSHRPPRRKRKLDQIKCLRACVSVLFLHSAEYLRFHEIIVQAAR